MAKRSYLLRRPRDDDEDDYYTQPEMVKAKPIDAKVARKLDPSYGGGKDFVKASQKSQQEFYGNQEVLGCPSGSSSQGQYREMDHDERNKISASIIKAELKGDTERVRKLKRKLEEGIIEVKEANTDQPGSNERTSVVLMQMDSRSGMPVPAKPRKQPPTAAITSIANKREMKGPVDEDYDRQMDLNEMVAAERRMTAEDQIMMFGPTVEARAETQTDGNDDLDDNNILLNQSKKRRHQQEKETRLNDRRRIQEHKFVEQTLDSCPKCIESRLLEKHSIVATGLKTYLAVVNWDGLAPDHCYIAPMGHCPSSVVLDEDVWDEMQLWMKGLVAMWRDDEDQDCVFVENASHLREQRHMIIECIPLPRELGDMAPIYFKKAILESEKEWSDNKKLIELSRNPKRSAGVRGLIPKGFPYFSINFGLQPGYAHVIEDERNFPSNFAQEIIGGMLDLSHQTWKNPKRQSFDEVKQKKAQLREKWMKYDWTEIVKRGINGEGDAQQEEKNEDEDNPETIL